MPLSLALEAPGLSKSPLTGGRAAYGRGMNLLGAGQACGAGEAGLTEGGALERLLTQARLRTPGVRGAPPLARRGVVRLSQHLAHLKPWRRTAMVSDSDFSALSLDAHAVIPPRQPAGQAKTLSGRTLMRTSLALWLGDVPPAWLQAQGRQRCTICGLSVSTRHGIHPTCRPAAREAVTPAFTCRTCWMRPASRPCPRGNNGVSILPSRPGGELLLTHCCRGPSCLWPSQGSRARAMWPRSNTSSGSLPGAT